MYLRNFWYAAARDWEVGNQELFARTIMNEPVLLYRTEGGAVAALEDACPHRQAPLSLGRRKGDVVQCVYHGLEFDAAGTCVHIPGQKAIPPDSSVRRFPVAEKWRHIWVWMGDPALADENMIPPFKWIEDPEWEMCGGVYPMNGHYQLLVDNLLDLTHLAYLHDGFIGDASMAEKASVKTTRDGDRVIMQRFTPDGGAPPTWRKLRGLPEKIDRLQRIEFIAPNNILIESSAAPAGSGLGDGDRSQATSHVIQNSCTPESDATVNWFWSLSRNYALEDRKLTRQYHDELQLVFAEDAEMVEAQQRYYDVHPDCRKLDVNIDTAILEAARINRRLADEETARFAAE